MADYMAQFTDISQGLQAGVKRPAGRLERFTAQLEFAHQLGALHPDRAAEWQEGIVAAGRLVQEGLQRSSADVEDLVAKGEAALEPIAATAKEYSLLCVSHAHIDMNWMWSWPETVAVTNDTFTTMLVLLEEFPEFIFSQSQASVYHLIEKYNPPMFAQIRERAQEGRWEVTASQWVEGDKNMSSGESISRHLLYTRAYIQEKFGLGPEDITVDFEPDTFGHPATLPGILARGGIRYYYHCRGSRGPHLYWWIGPDGSRLLALNGMPWYMTIIDGKIAVDPKIVEPLADFARATGLKKLPVFYGVGDHGGGPTRQDLRRLLEMKRWPVYPNVEFSTLHNFFRIAEKEAQEVPEVTGERNFIFTGCYTSQARQKWANRHGENLLYAAEAAAVVGEKLAGVGYPAGNLTEAWKPILFSQFHDILPGSGVRETRHYTMGLAQESQAAAGMARTNALRGLAARVDTESLRRALQRDGEREYKDLVEADRSQGAGVGFGAGAGGESHFSVSRTSDRAFLVFNLLPHPRQEVVEAKLWDTELDLSQLVVTAEGCEPVQAQVLEQGNYWGHTFATVAFPVDLPALGYRAVCVSDRRAELGLAEQKIEDYWAGAGGSWRTIEPDESVLENEFIKVTLDPPSGGIASLVDKRRGREWVPEGKKSGIFQHILEQNEGMTAWVIGAFLKKEDLLDGGVLKKMQGGPHVQTYRWTRPVGERSRLELDITVRQGAARVEYRLKVDWREMGDRQQIPHLRVRFPLAVKKAEARYEIPYGSVVRELDGGEEVVVQRWADLSEKDGQGVLLANSSKYGYSLDGDTLNMTLLRASIDPDPLPDIGEHVIEYALVPHGRGWSAGDSMEAGEDFNVPLVVSSCGFQSGDLPASLSLVEVEDGNVRLVALKKSEEGQGVVLRLVEVEGKKTEARVALAPELVGKGATAIEVDTLERPVDGNGARLEDGALVVEVPAYGIAAVQIG